MHSRSIETDGAQQLTRRQDAQAQAPVRIARSGDAPTFSHGDFVRWHTAGLANAQKVLGQETDKQGWPVLVLWDAMTASCWTAPADRFVRVEAPAQREAA